jgi:hypothetical protein
MSVDIVSSRPERTPVPQRLVFLREIRAKRPVVENRADPFQFVDLPASAAFFSGGVACDSKTNVARVLTRSKWETVTARWPLCQG